MQSASVSVLGDQQNFVSVLSRKKRHLVRALSNSSVLERRLLLATLALLVIALALLIALIIFASCIRPIVNIAISYRGTSRYQLVQVSRLIDISPMCRLTRETSYYSTFNSW
ncbi:hypothetical protein J6590_070748 [Homalodisca vitripennis]|nr:hypothetical protein J6590_070748 [Homalodisca vitripennis]